MEGIAAQIPDAGDHAQITPGGRTGSRDQLCGRRRYPNMRHLPVSLRAQASNFDVAFVGIFVADS